MAKAKSWKREGLHTVTTRLIFKDAQKAVAFYENAFGAKCRGLATTPDGKRILHGEIQIVDKFKAAVDAGCTIKMPVADMFWGDRFGVVKDPFGYTWELSTHIEDLTDAEMKDRVEQAFSQMTRAK